MNMANIDRLSFIVVIFSVSLFSSVENANQHCDFLCSVLGMHAHASMRNVINYNCSPWCEST